MIIGEAITAKPKPRTPWIEELIKSNIAIKVTSKKVKSNGKFNQFLLRLVLEFLHHQNVFQVLFLKIIIFHLNEIQILHHHLESIEYW